MGMELKGYDAGTMTKVLAAIDSINPMNGIVTTFVDYAISARLVSTNLMWQDEGGDLFEDFALTEWNRSGGDVRDLAKILDLDIEVTL